MTKYLLNTLLGFMFITAGTHAQAFKVGSVVPTTLAVTDSNGQSHTFAEWRGQPLVLEWTNYGCPFVRKHYDSKNMQNTQAAVTAQGVRWVSVISSAPGKEGYLTPAQAPAAIAKQGFKGTLVALDPSGELGQAFGATNTPTMVVLNAEGKVMYFGAIDSIASFSPEDITKATNYVTQAVQNVLANTPVEPATTRPYGCSVKY